MIRVLHVVTHLDRGGLETMIMNYYRRINREKIQFDFLVQGEHVGEYENEIRGLGGKIYRVKEIKHFFPWEFEREVYNFLKQHKQYKIVHSHINAFSKYVLIAAKKAHVPNRIAHSHIVLKSRNLKTVYKNLAKIGINKYSTRRYACSNEAGEWLYGKEKFEILANAINLQEFEFDIDQRKKYRNEFKIGNKFAVCSIGRFTEQKNHIFLLEVFNEIQKQKDSVLILIGDGGLREKYEEKIKELNLQGKVILTGVRNDVNKIMNAIDAFVFPSLYEGLGIVLIEAQANGLQCYASDRVTKEADVTNTIEFLSLNKTAKEWAELIINKPNQRIDISKVKEIQSAGYDICKATKKLEGIYLKLIKQ